MEAVAAKVRRPGVQKGNISGGGWRFGKRCIRKDTTVVRPGDSIYSSGYFEGETSMLKMMFRSARALTAAPWFAMARTGVAAGRVTRFAASRIHITLARA